MVFKQNPDNKCHVCLGSYIQIREIEIRVAQNVARSELIETNPAGPISNHFRCFFMGRKMSTIVFFFAVILLGLMGPIHPLWNRGPEVCRALGPEVWPWEPFRPISENLENPGQKIYVRKLFWAPICFLKGK